MKNKEQILSDIQLGKISLESVVERLVYLEYEYSKRNDISKFQNAFEEFLGCQLKSYCNGFFSKDYDLHNYVVISVNAFGAIDEPCTNVIIKHKENDDVLEEKIYYPFSNTLEMLCEWTETDKNIFDNLLKRGETS